MQLSFPMLAAQPSGGAGLSGVGFGAAGSGGVGDGGAVSSGESRAAEAGPPGAAAVTSEAAWRRRRRVELGGGAWLEIVRGFVPDHLRLFDLLRRGADWELHERQMYERVVAVPRLVASCPGARIGRPWLGESVVRLVPHGASADEVECAARVLRGTGRHLSSRYGKSLASISLAFYRDGNDSVAFHGDKLGALRPDTVVAILSLGAPRHFLLRRALGPVGGPPSSSALPEALVTAGIGVVRGRGSQRPTFALSVGEGDLLVMGGSCQETWEHAVPKEPRAAERIAVMFREIWDEAEGGVRNVRGPQARVSVAGSFSEHRRGG